MTNIKVTAPFSLILTYSSFIQRCLGDIFFFWQHVSRSTLIVSLDGRQRIAFRYSSLPWVKVHTYSFIVEKQSHYRPGQALGVPGGLGSQSSRQSAHEGGKDRQPYAPAAFTAQEIFLVHISVRGWVDPRATVRPGGLRQWKIAMTPPAIDLQPAG